MTPTRRTGRIAVIAAALAAALALTACAAGIDAGDEDAAGSEAALLPAAEGATSYPLTLASPFGDTVLEDRPERVAIITASTVDTDALIALGGTPVIAPSTVDRNPWLDQTAIAGIETLWDSSAGEDLSVETIAAAEPDLIVNLFAYDTLDQARFDKLEGIAPVLYAAADDLSWQEITRALGEALDLSAAADDVVTDAEDAIVATRDAHPEFAGKTAAHVIVYPEEWGAYYASHTGSDTAALFDALGFELPAVAAEFGEEDVLSNELVGKADADFLLLSTFGEDSEYFLDSELVQRIPALVDGRAVIDDADPETGTNSFAWGLNVQSALSLPWLIDRLAGFGAEALG